MVEILKQFSHLCIWNCYVIDRAGSHFGYVNLSCLFYTSTLTTSVDQVVIVLKPIIGPEASSVWTNKVSLLPKKSSELFTRRQVHRDWKSWRSYGKRIKESWTQCRKHQIVWHSLCFTSAEIKNLNIALHFCCWTALIRLIIQEPTS